MPKRDEDLLIADIIQSCEKIFRYTNDLSLDDFLKNDLVVDAVVRNFEIIGEAAKLISEELRLLNPLIEWQLMSDFRNLLIHEYFGIDYEIVWNVVKNELVFNYELIKQFRIPEQKNPKA
jgi:uncharacterized protein with HEPN domain